MAGPNSVWNNGNQYQQVVGMQGTQMVMGQPVYAYNDGVYDFPNLTTVYTADRLVDNPEEDAWTKRNIKIKEIGNEGAVKYSFRPALVPISNFNPTSSIGNKSIGTGLNVTGNNILYLQQEFWINEFSQMTKNKFLDAILTGLMSEYPKSLAIVKQSLSLLECSLFCLATGQFYFANFIGKKNPPDLGDPNSVTQGELNLIWSTQQPAKAPLAKIWNIQNTPLWNELRRLSNFVLKYPMSLGMWNVGYDMKKLNWIISYYVKNNLAMSMDLGWPTETNVSMVKNGTIDGAIIDRWFNFITSSTTTIPFLQNYVAQVTPEQLPVNNNGGQILGFGANNVMSFSFLGYVCAMSIFEGAIESYYTQPVPMNPFNLSGTKLWYRIGNVFGWGQVHVPNYWGTNYMFLDTDYGMKITNFTEVAAGGTPDSDWSIKTVGTTEDNDDPLITAIKTANGITYTATYQLLYNQILTDQTQAQALLLEWEPNMGYGDFCFPKLPTSINQVIPGNVVGFTYSKWLQYRDLKSQDFPVTVTSTGQRTTIGDLTKIGWNQMTYSDWNITFAFPADAPVVAN